MRVLIAGAGGQLGAVMVPCLRRAGHDVLALSRQGLDIAQHTEVMRTVEAARPDVIVNCAAFNDVDGAEDRYQDAFDGNAFAVRSLARAARQAGSTLVHFSTDFVFDGLADRPYTETDRVRPQSVYASSKYLGERFAAETPQAYVVRVESLFGGEARRSSIDRILRTLRAGHEAPVFVDRIVSPSYVVDVADATNHLLAVDAPFGLYHCVNSGYATWFEVGREIARVAGVDAGLLRPVRVAEITLKAKRPQFAALDNAKLLATGAVMRSWQEAVACYVALDRASTPS